MARILILAAMIGLGFSAQAARADSLRTASDLGNVIASEEHCGLTYNQAAIDAFVGEKVDASDMRFPGLLTMMIGGVELRLEEMSASAKTAHCAQIRRVAKSYGFID